MAYSSTDLRKWLSVNNSPLLGRNMAGTMEECEFPCFSIKPSACQEENNTSKEWWRPGLIDHRSYPDIRSCVCTVVDSFMEWCCCASLKSPFHISAMRAVLWIWKRASRQNFLTFRMSGLHLWTHQCARTATLSSLYQMSLMKNEVTFAGWDILSNTNWGF